MIMLEITKTGKSYAPKSEYNIFDREEQKFKDMTAALAWIKETYGKCKRFAMRRDPDGKKCGWIFGFRNNDISHVPVEKWLQQDWVSIYEVKPVTLEG